ncbi:TDP-N-acetylfucosamine:lipid II N-acetylfucosaminyltransferase [Cetobacterium sp. ZOR0034]|uniref:TDP-N-acetylfucosamine:lipid II N-acetylfucosaminyltransferase n=1 Tax=Cetobacterium sp. ZOR0034 TaxID=1339239 RepID=UPI000647844A|nr:TDP-N-acetylfucosamine:lipid II N-acetylfucosaminyltransferase [Cetobacterium sp. ZOR0034]
MKYLHIMPNEKFIVSYIEFIEKSFKINDHLFYIMSGVNYINIPNKKRVKSFNKKIKNSFLKKLYMILSYLRIYINMIKSKKIILHSLLSSLTILFLFFNPWFLKKCNWVMWGGDLYSYRNRNINSFKKKIYYKMEDYVKKNIGQISYLAEGDYYLAKEFYDVKGVGKRAIYINPVDLSSLEKYKDKKNNKDILNIQVGNSADPENNHLEILDKLEKFKGENIKIFVPLSYGNTENALKVKKYGEDKFGEKFIGMLEFFKPEKYAEYLSDIDILIFNHNRQQGLGNIFALAYLNKKIYMRSDISSWDYLKNDLNLEIHDVVEINKFEDLKKNQIISNKEKVLKTVYSDEYIKKIWEENFNV